MLPVFNNFFKICSILFLAGGALLYAQSIRYSHFKPIGENIGLGELSNKFNFEYRTIIFIAIPILIGTFIYKTVKRNQLKFDLFDVNGSFSSENKFQFNWRYLLVLLIVICGAFLFNFIMNFYFNNRQVSSRESEINLQPAVDEQSQISVPQSEYLVPSVPLAAEFKRNRLKKQNQNSILEQQNPSIDLSNCYACSPDCGCCNPVN